MPERLEVRLDSERRLKLERMSKSRGVPISRLVREIIDEAYEESLQEERLKAAERIGSLSIEDVPDGETLSRQLDETHELPSLR